MSAPNSTSPVTPQQVFRGGLKEIFWAPVSWVPLIPSMCAVAFLPLPWWANGALIGAPVALVATYWAKSWPRLANIVRGKLLLEQNRREEASLGDVTYKMSTSGHSHEAAVLGKARGVLADITAINQEGSPTAQALRIETVAREIYDQMVIKARALPEQPDKECLASFKKSLTTMQDSLAFLQRQAEVIKGMSQVPEEDRLAHLQETLQSENTIGNQVIDRVQENTKLSE